MAGTRKIVTVHSPVPEAALNALLTGIEDALHSSGASRVWIDGTWSPDMVVMADFAPRAAGPGEKRP